jgi:hypothetical protein
MEKDLLGYNDAMLGDLADWDGHWSLTASGKLSFKRKANQAAYTALEQKYNAVVMDMQKLQAEATAAAAAAASPSASPSPSPSATP